MYYYVDDTKGTPADPLLPGTGEGAGGWQPYNANTDIGTSKYISIGQGFGIVQQANSALHFEKNYRTHEGSNIFHKKQKTFNSYFELVTSSEGFGNDKVYFRENKNTTEAYDVNYDAYKLSSFGDNPNTSFISSDDVKLSICEMPETESVELAFVMGVSGEATFSLENVKDFTSIIVEDRKENVFVDLIKDKYTFAYSKDDKETGRFALHFSKSALSDKEIGISQTKIYSYRKTIFIESNEALNNAKVNIYSINGELVFYKEFSEISKEQIKTDLIEGIYIIEFSSELGTVSSKINLTTK